MRHSALTISLLASLAALGCQEESVSTGPEEVVRQYVSAMRKVHGEPEAGDVVIQLLSEKARENLEERAKRASALSGRELSPGEMIVPSWFALHIQPRSYVAREDGNWAEVTVHGEEGDTVQVRCVKEEDRWKVALHLPHLAPIRMREEER